MSLPDENDVNAKLKNCRTVSPDERTKERSQSRESSVVSDYGDENSDDLNTLNDMGPCHNTRLAHKRASTKIVHNIQIPHKEMSPMHLEPINEIENSPERDSNPKRNSPPPVSISNQSINPTTETNQMGDFQNSTISTANAYESLDQHGRHTPDQETQGQYLQLPHFRPTNWSLLDQLDKMKEKLYQFYVKFLYIFDIKFTKSVIFGLISVFVLVAAVAATLSNPQSQPNENVVSEISLPTEPFSDKITTPAPVSNVEPFSDFLVEHSPDSLEVQFPDSVSESSPNSIVKSSSASNTLPSPGSFHDQSPDSLAEQYPDSTTKPSLDSFVEESQDSHSVQYPDSTNEPSPDSTFNSITNEFEEEISNIFHNDHFSILSYLGDELSLNGKDKKVVTLLIGGSNSEEIENFVKKLISTTTTHFGYTFSELKASPQTSRFDLFTSASEELQKNHGRVALSLKNIDLLEGDTPLVLQSLAEVDDPKFRNSFLVFTTVLPNSEMLNIEEEKEKECNEILRRYIKEKWSDNNLPDGKMGAILSRIGEIAICLDTNNA